LGGRNFCPPASVPVPFEQRKNGRGVWGATAPEQSSVLGKNSAFPLRNQIEASPATCPNTWRAEHRRKILFSLKEEKIGGAPCLPAGRQNEKSKEYFSVVWRACRAVAGVPARRSVSVGRASLLGVLLQKCSNINQKTPPRITQGFQGAKRTLIPHTRSGCGANPSLSTNPHITQNNNIPTPKNTIAYRQSFL